MIKKKFSRKEISLGIICSIMVVFILSFYIWHQMESIRLGYNARKLEYQIKVLETDIKKLETIKSSYLALEKVEKIAREKLNLFPPRKDQIIYDDLVLKVKKNK